MKKPRVLALAALLLSLPAAVAALADVSFSVGGFRAPLDAGISRVGIWLTGGGATEVILDPNRCSRRPKGGTICTKIAVQQRLGRLEVIEDRRGSDGPLLLQVAEGVRLEVGSGFNIEGKITFTAILVTETGGETRVPLEPVVSAEVK